MSEGTPALPRHSAVFGLTILASIAVPMSGTVSVLDWLARIFQRDPVAGLMTLFTIGSPFLFGLAVGLAGVLRDHDLAARLIRLPLVLVHTMLALYALLVAQVPGAVPLRWPFVGFAGVACLYFIYSSAEADAAGRPLRPAWLARWGGVVLAGLAAWLEFQTLGHRPFGPALHLALAAAALLAATAPRRPGRPADDDPTLN